MAADAAAGTASLRSLGTTSTTAAAGNHTSPAASTSTAGHIAADDQKRLSVQSLGDITGSVTINLALGHIIKARATGNLSITLSNPLSDSDVYIQIAQDGTGSRTVTWVTTIKWKDAVTPVATTTINKKDIFLLHYDGTDYLGTASLNF